MQYRSVNDNGMIDTRRITDAEGRHIADVKVIVGPKTGLKTRQLTVRVERPAYTWDVDPLVTLNADVEPRRKVE